MGRNIDMKEFGICDLKCELCKEELDISEVDMDCDLTTHSPNTFELSVQCSNCQKDNIINFLLKRV